MVDPSEHKQSPHVAVFGGAGFIGRHLTGFLLRSHAGARVTLADIEPPAWELPSGANFVRCDVREPIRGVADAELIINLAAVHRTPGHADAEYHETNETGAREILAFAERCGAQRVWFTSSIAVYGPDEAAKTEQSQPRPASAYGKSKLNAEAEHRRWAGAAPGRRLVIARPATVFGPGEGGNFTRLADALRRHTFVYPGRRDTLKACGYVGDLGPSFAFMEQFADPVALYNFAYPEPPTIEQVCNAFHDQGGLPRPLMTVPAPLLLRMGAVLKFAGLAAFDPERIRKLMISTNVRGDELSARGYAWSGDLRAAVAEWRDADPKGEFV